jgi:deoxyribose-phosphate aldolase
MRKSVRLPLALKAGAHFVKTSTGFSKSGATVEDVRLMRMESAMIWGQGFRGNPLLR